MNPKGESEEIYEVRERPVNGASFRKRELSGEMTTIDCEGIESARESHYTIARVIRSLRVVGLKLQAKAVYRYFKQFSDEVGDAKEPSEDCNVRQ